MGWYRENGSKDAVAVAGMRVASRAVPFARTCASHVLCLRGVNRSAGTTLYPRASPICAGTHTVDSDLEVLETTAVGEMKRDAEKLETTRAATGVLSRRVRYKWYPVVCSRAAQHSALPLNGTGKRKVRIDYSEITFRLVPVCWVRDGPHLLTCSLLTPSLRCKRFDFMYNAIH